MELKQRLKIICEQSRASTPADRAVIELDEHRDAVPPTGRSLSTVQFAVVKTGDPDSLATEVAYLRVLASGVGPKILGEWRGGYAMERLYPVGGRDLLLRSWLLLSDQVWRRPAYLCHRYDWQQEFAERFGCSDIPELVTTEGPVTIHGDPTVCNTMQNTEGKLRLIDPVVGRRGVPSFRSVDLGKMIQSMLGWEQLLTGEVQPDYISPFEGEAEDTVRRAAFWCRMHLRRIAMRESLPGRDPSIVVWCEQRSEMLREVSA